MRAFQTDGSNPIPYLDKGARVDIFGFWTQRCVRRKYPILFKVACAAFSIFHGPKIEGTFSVMGNIITKGRSRTSIETYAAYQSVKMFLKSKKKTAPQYFQTVDMDIARSILGASKRESERTSNNQNQISQRRDALNIEKPQTATSCRKKLVTEQVKLHKRHVKGVERSSASGPSTSSAGPSTSSAGPSTSSARPSTSSAGPSTSSAGPSTVGKRKRQTTLQCFVKKSKKN